jgi:endonuclease G
MDLSGIYADPELRDELIDGLGGARRGRAIVEDDGGGFFPDNDPRIQAPDQESIILLKGRPVLFVRKSSFETPRSKVWSARLTASRESLETAFPAVGRIEVKNHPSFDWIGTGWVVATDLIVTNRHVAREFSRREMGQFVLRKNVSGKSIKPSIDFRAEHMEPDEAEFKVVDVLYMEEDEDGPDLALLHIASEDTPPPRPIPLGDVVPGMQVAVIGYPAQDSRCKDSNAMERIFGHVYDVKRLAPGRIREVQPHYLTHDCTTLGGNSGSVLISLETGKAVGLHYGGRHRDQNYAVPSSVIRARLSAFGR